MQKDSRILPAIYSVFPGWQNLRRFRPARQADFKPGTHPHIAMFRRFKTLILFMALAAPPLRGMAAVAMWHCAQDQHDPIYASAEQHAQFHAQSPQSPESPESPEGHVDQAAAHDPAHAAHDPAHDPVTNATVPADESTPQVSSHCISAVGGAAAASVWAAFSFAPVGANRIPFIEQRFVAVVPAQLDRPPLVQSL